MPRFVRVKTINDDEYVIDLSRIQFAERRTGEDKPYWHIMGESGAFPGLLHVSDEDAERLFKLLPGAG